jgi:hypothetical protein
LVKPRSGGTLDTYWCNIPLPAGVAIDEILAYGYATAAGTSSSYFEASAYGLGNTTFAPTCWSSNACTWQNSVGLPSGNILLTLHSGSAYTLLSGARYGIAFALKSTSSSPYAYGFRIHYVEGGVGKYMSVAAKGCTIQD